MTFINWRNLQQYSWKFNFVPLFFSFLAYAITLIFSSYAWSRIVNHLAQPLNWRYHFRSYLISRLGFRLSGPLLQVPGRILMYRVSLDRRVITFASALELVLAVVAGSILVIFIGDQFKSIASLIWVVFALVVGCVVIQPKILHGILRLIKVESLQPIQLRHSVEWTYITSLFG